jgi:hypothetical protein
MRDIAERTGGQIQTEPEGTSVARPSGCWIRGLPLLCAFLKASGVSPMVACYQPKPATVLCLLESLGREPDGSLLSA